jgi:tetratricopeptide (TPR) repeat protein
MDEVSVPSRAPAPASGIVSRLTASPSASLAAVILACAAALAVQHVIGAPLEALVLRLPGVDKPLHFAGFAIMFVVVERLLRGTAMSARARILTALAAGAALALSDEGLQSMLPHRHVEVADLAADACGLAAGAALVWPGPIMSRRAVIAGAAVAAGALTWTSHLATRDYSYGVLAESRRDYREARRYYLKAFESGVRTPDLYNGLGWVEIESGEGDPIKAVEYARIALTARPDDPDILDTYGWALLHAGRPAEALPPLLRSFEKKPQMYCIHYHLGQTYRHLGRIADARREFELQLTRTPKGPDAATARTALEQLDADSER